MKTTNTILSEMVIKDIKVEIKSIIDNIKCKCGKCEKCEK